MKSMLIKLRYPQTLGMRCKSPCPLRCGAVVFAKSAVRHFRPFSFSYRPAQRLAPSALIWAAPPRRASIAGQPPKAAPGPKTAPCPHRKDAGRRRRGCFPPRRAGEPVSLKGARLHVPSAESVGPGNLHFAFAEIIVVPAYRPLMTNVWQPGTNTGSGNPSPALFASF